MQEDFQQQPYQYQQPQQYQPGMSPTTKKWLTVLGVLLVIGAFAYVGITSYLARQRTGILDISTSSSSAVLTVQASNSQSKEVGKGSAKVRLDPGLYHLSATEKDGAATQTTVTVTKQKTTTVSLDIQKLVPTQKVIKYNSQNIFANDSDVYFLNNAESLLYNFQLGDASAKPYRTTLNPISQVYWYSPTKFFAYLNGSWVYVNGSQVSKVTLGKTVPDVNSISFNAKGEVAFVAEKKVALANSLTQQPRQVGTTQHDGTQTSISPNGKVMVYTPIINYGDTAEPTRMYSGDSSTTLPDSLKGINNVRWAPDDSKFSYTTNDGIFVYDFGSKTTKQVFAGNPTNQLSVTWLSDTHLIYAESGAIWNYRTDSAASYKATNFDGILNAAQPFTIASDGETVYFGTAQDSKDRGGYVYRFLPNYNNLPAEQQQKLKEIQQQSSSPTPPAITGLDSFINSGLAMDQVNNLNYALTQFSTKNKISKIDVDPSTINVDLDPHRASNSLTFTFSDDKNNKYNGKLEYSGVSAIRLFVYDTAGKQVFDSEALNAAN